MKAILTRYYTPGLGTVGELVLGTFKCVTIERDWINNKQEISCIPEGVYQCKLGPSSKNLPYSTMAYEVRDVPNRTLIKIHVANYPHELEGCIGLGRYILGESKSMMIAKSAETVLEFHKVLNEEEFELEIVQYKP